MSKVSGFLPRIEYGVTFFRRNDGVFFPNVNTAWQTHVAMPINYQRIRNITALEIESALFRDGFVPARRGGGHRQYRHDATNRNVTLAWHGRGQTLSLGTLRRIIERQAQWTEADLIRLGLIRD